ncbi:MAG: glycosyltransferase [Spirochaetes bacterium]|nr:glycosyltransferase [Spirochaetota bacterium]
MKLVSVIIPCYKAAKFIRGTIESVLRQTYKNFEIIIIDDGSRDNTKTVIKDLIRKKNIRYYYHKENLGVSASTNLGIKRSKGLYLAFLDHDDRYFPAKLEICMKALETGRGDIVYGNAVYQDVERKTKKIYVPPPKKNYSDFEYILINLNPIPSSSSVMMRKDCFKKTGLFNIDLKAKAGVQDFDMWLRLSKAGFKFFHIDQDLIQYNLSRRKGSSLKKENVRDLIHDLKSVFNRFIKYLKGTKKKQALTNYYMRLASLFLDLDKKRSFDYFVQSETAKLNLRFALLYLAGFFRRLFS